MDYKQPQAGGSVPAQSAPGKQRVPEKLPARAEAVVKQEAYHDAHQYAAAIQPDANHNVTAPEMTAAQDYTHLMPATHNRVPSVGGNLTDPSDHTTPMESGMSSGPSVQNTPNTHLTEITPSPRSDGIPDIRNSSSPYAGSSAHHAPTTRGTMTGRTMGGKGFPRKDNWRRHMINKHSINPTEDPEPHFVDETMTGT
ncbi:conserved hypothetical protein [Verticillium alfalfae VaMs.102]|uniref:Uncharacterized protein n=1 Tax=Verticillium alfalfae (strain VaMs.102 / ATCC MYA-4576 / FGSC 10136) TaxID=526221 RepID=C9S6Y2_VERA1|nr:conserved hypothetical protein [Verticillium alfalfae VaMs.102]EEY14593.1 conserved hypothetical protein [Verticillium alfalfae VaMs.102]